MLDLKNSILNERECILTTVKQYVESKLGPRRKTILNHFKESFEEVPGIQNILMELDITLEEYYNALSILCDSDFQSHIKREPNAWFIKFFLKVTSFEGKYWYASSIVNHYKAVTYMCVYFSKSEDKTWVIRNWAKWSEVSVAKLPDIALSLMLMWKILSINVLNLGVWLVGIFICGKKLFE